MQNDSVTRSLEEYRREFDKQFSLMEKRVDSQIASEMAELRANRRWIVGTIITVRLALAGYLSAVIHFTH